MRRHRRKLRLLAAAVLTFSLSGCAWFWGGHGWGDHHSSTPLVSFLYANGQVPQVTPQVELHLPIRVGVSFLPEAEGRLNGGATEVDRDKVLNAIRDRFKSLGYVREIVVVPSYYLHYGNGDGLAQIQQLSQLYQFDLFALVSYDQLLDQTQNHASFFYLTIVGAFVVPGDRNETHTLLDLAVIDPRSRALVLRAGGTSSLGNTVAAVSVESNSITQRTRGFELATANLLDNFQTELTAFEARVKEGTAPIRVVRGGAPAAGGHGGGGALDPALLATLLGCLGIAQLARRRVRPGVRASRGTRSSASARSSVRD